VIKDIRFVEMRVGQFGADRPQTPNGTAPRFEDVGNLIVTGGNRDWQENFRRNQVLGSVSYFKDRWAGSHHFKAGGEIFRTMAAEIWRTAYPGDVLHVLRNGANSEVYLFQTQRSNRNPRFNVRRLFTLQESFAYAEYVHKPLSDREGWTA
jgi:hypothetical protein